VLQERKAVLEALSRIHDAGVLHDRIQMDHIMIQRKQVTPKERLQLP
jgi:hypothetical protein